tara:strand:- start:1726 stop:2040 length:315 start_codon:yes stop_codon:yes gene_type:complete
MKGKIIFECRDCRADLTIEHEGALVSSKHICVQCGEQYLVSLAMMQPTNSKNTYRNEAWLKEAYEGNSRSMADIAKQCAVSPMTIYKWLTTHGIETRPTGRRKE